MKEDDIKAYKAWLEEVKSNPKLELKAIKIVGYASPEGEEDKNNTLSTDRAASSKPRGTTSPSSSRLDKTVRARCLAQKLHSESLIRLKKEELVNAGFFPKELLNEDPEQHRKKERDGGGAWPRGEVHPDDYNKKMDWDQHEQDMAQLRLDYYDRDPECEYLYPSPQSTPSSPIHHPAIEHNNNRTLVGYDTVVDRKTGQRHRVEVHDMEEAHPDVDHPGTHDDHREQAAVPHGKGDDHEAQNIEYDMTQN